MEYIRYTERRAIARPFKPMDQEHSGYETVPCFQREHSYALPHRQRHLTALILRKLLASSSQAIAATLDALRAPLQTLREAQASSDPEFTVQLIRSDEVEDDLLVEILVETEVADQPETPQDTIDRHQPEEKIEGRQRLATRARAIGIVAKARALLRVLEVGFEQMATTGAHPQGADRRRVAADAGASEGFSRDARAPGEGRALQRYQSRAGGYGNLPALVRREPRRWQCRGLTGGESTRGAHRVITGSGHHSASHRGRGRTHQSAILLTGGETRSSLEPQRSRRWSGRQPRKRREIFKAEDEIIEKRDQPIDSLERQLDQPNEKETLFTIRWYAK